MKAYRLWIDGQEEAGTPIVFATTAKEAKKQVFDHEGLVDALEGGWIDLRVNRDKCYDGMDNLSPAEFAKHQWRDGWQWFDTDYPDPENATDEEFIEWYNALYAPKGAKK